MALTYSTLRKPTNAQVVDPSTGRMREEWALYFDQLTTRLNSAVGELGVDYVQGPASATNGNLAAFDGASGTLLEDSGIAAANVVTAAAVLTDDGFVVGAGGSRGVETVTAASARNLIGLDSDDDVTFASLAADELTSDALILDGLLLQPAVQLLASGTVSSAATLDLVLTAYTGYRGLIIELSGFLPATDGVDISIRFSTDGGASYDAGASDYSWGARREGDAAAGANAGDNADTEIHIIGAAEIGNAASEGINLTVKLMAQTSGSLWPKAAWHGVYVSSAATPALNEIHGAGVRRAAQDTDAVRFLFNTGNIASCSYAIFGLL